MSGISQAVVLITGIQAAGKSSVAQALAERLPKSVHLRGDTFRRMIVNGGADMTPEQHADAVAQLRLRHRLTAQAADTYFQAGFTVVAQDVVLGAELRHLVEQIHSRPLLLVVLAPSQEAVAAREAGRTKKAYGTWTVQQLDEGLRQDTPRLGLWLDTSTHTVEQTVTEILDRAWTEAAVR
ncbi:AAA family ATPase [Goodfellowiella coeruleoviolacea]|uniref:Adenylylsulfate kinase n=1 Tax=Goodfellowiella coeruleoviolacea TaxID=334858 RepID=A0AAE3GEL4_9PSEU|nr:AAA family ATPase [Goodfellowiella coeruleoviolacea]MCP2164713.1 Adenylylsulfate kinase [Goodfellowiella coeruleoviolacea]